MDDNKLHPISPLGNRLGLSKNHNNDKRLLNLKQFQRQEKLLKKTKWLKNQSA